MFSQSSDVVLLLARQTNLIIKQVGWIKCGCHQKCVTSVQHHQLTNKTKTAGHILLSGSTVELICNRLHGSYNSMCVSYIKLKQYLTDVFQFQESFRLLCNVYVLLCMCMLYNIYAHVNFCQLHHKMFNQSSDVVLSLARQTNMIMKQAGV